MSAPAKTEHIGFDPSASTLPGTKDTVTMLSSSTPAALRVLYVGGLPRSGSTLMDLVLHHLPGHLGVGELFYLWRNCVVHDGLCSCGQPFSKCAFWQAVGDEAYGGWDHIDAHEVMRLQGVVDKSVAIPLLLTPVRPKAFQRALDAYTDILEPLYRAILAVSGERIVVDSSKRPSLAFVLRSMPSIDLRVAHVVRDPRGVAFSFSKHVALDPGVALKDEMPRSTPRRVARRWLTVNATVASLRRLGVPLVCVRYEDLVHSPQRELKRILEMEDIPADSLSPDLLSPDGVTIPATHSIASGRIRLASGEVSLNVDDAWRHDMVASDRRLVSAVTVLSRRRYGYR